MNAENVDYMQKYMESVENLFATMLSSQVTFDEPRLKNHDETWLDVSTSLGITGGLTGLMTLSFSREVAENIVTSFVGMSIDFEDEDFSDAIGEIGNIVAGNAKAKMDDHGHLSITVPTVTFGACQVRVKQDNTPTRVVDCDTDYGIFKLELTIGTTVCEIEQSLTNG